MNTSMITPGVGAVVASRPTSSLAVVLAALDEHGWEYSADTASVRVPDPEHPGYGSRFASRRYQVPKISVPGFKVEVKGHHSGGLSFGSTSGFTLGFSEKGNYLPGNTSGGYPVTKGTALASVLEHIARQAPAVVEARLREQEEGRRLRKEQEAREVAEAYAEATQQVTQAQEALADHLREMGLDESQVRAVLISAQTPNNPFGTLSGALFHQERVGRGWGRGNTNLSGNYENGVRV